MPIVDDSFVPIVPLAALVEQSRVAEDYYLQRLASLPPRIKALVLSRRVGAFVRGLVSTYDLPEQAASQLSFAVLQVSFGELALARLADALVKEIGMSMETARRMADEITRDLFEPVREDLERYRQAKASGASKISPSLAPPPLSGASNVLNLKETPTPPVPPPMPPAR